MKLIAGHKYLRGDKGMIIPYSELMEKVSGFEVYVPKETIVNDMQFAENDKLRSAAERKIIQAKEPAKTVPVAKKMQHMDIRDEMQQDLTEQ